MRTDAHGLVDPPAQMAALAARVAADPASLGSALSALLGGCLVQHEPDRSAAGHGPSVMRLEDPAGGMILLTRLAPTFTPAEFARAHGLVEAARSVAIGRLSPVALLLPDGAELTLRHADSADAANHCVRPR